MSDLIAYRVYFRSPGSFWSGRRQRSIVVLGEAALERQLARKSPLAIWFFGALVHRCQICAREGLWDERWICWQRYGARHEARGEGEDIYCSPDCARSENAGFNPPHWMNLNDEPLPIEAQRRLWAAQRRDADAQAAARKAVRGVPMPEWPGDGWCKWCGLAVPKPRKSWHAECYREYALHTDQGVQARFLRQRDGPECGWPGCKARGCEVDHKVPLWKVAGLAAEFRRWYFSPANLWLLCSRHHKAKTALEAAERAETRRLSPREAPEQGQLFSG